MIDEKKWLPLQLSVIYMFSGLSMGVGMVIVHEFPLPIIILLYFGSLYTSSLLTTYCKNNKLKIFRKIDMTIFGLLLWAVSMFSVIILMK